MKTLSKRQLLLFVFHTAILIPILIISVLIISINSYITSEYYKPSTFIYSSNEVIWRNDNDGFINIRIYLGIHDPYSDVALWYMNKGFVCDGLCEDTDYIHIIEKYYFICWKTIKPADIYLENYPVEIELLKQCSIKRLDYK